MTNTLGASITRPSLLLRIRDAQDSSAWSEFVGLYGGMIFQYCQRRHIQPADAAEITQEVLIQVGRSIGTFNYEPLRGKFRNWLAAIVRSKLIALMRSQVRYQTRMEQVQSLEQCESGEDSAWIDVWHQQILLAALNHLRKRLSPETFAAFKATWLEDRSVSDVAQAMGQPVSWVYVAKSRGLKQLKAIVIELAGDAAWAE